MSDNIATLAGFTRECEAHNDSGHVLFLLVRPRDVDFAAHFTRAWDTDAQAFVTLETHAYRFYGIGWRQFA
jgi:hypothetical protein